MSRYDWSWNRGYDRGFRPRPMRGYGSDFGRPGRGWGGPPVGGWSRWAGPPRGMRRPYRYDRGEYGDAYPGFGYSGYAPRAGSWGRARGYDAPHFREPFVPEPLHHQSELDEDAQPFELSDEEIRTAVRQNLFNDSWIDAERIQVEVADRVVTLTGEVDDYLEARYAWDDAWEAVGVRGVVNQLTVRNEPGPSAEPKAPRKQAKKTK